MFVHYLDVSVNIIYKSLNFILHLMEESEEELKSLLMKVKRRVEVQFSHSVVSNSLRPHESQHARPACPSPTPGVHSDSHPSSP